MLIPLYGFIDLNWKLERILRYYKALKVSKYKKNFVLNPKLLTKKKKIIEIDTINMFRIKKFLKERQENLNSIKDKNKFFIKKGDFVLEIKLKNKLQNLKFLPANKIKYFLQNEYIKVS